MVEQMEVISADPGTKQKIFMAAAQLFFERGYNGVSIREICEKTGVSKPTLYYYFGNKEGIYKALVDAGTSLGANEYREVLDMGIPIKQKLTEIVKISFQQTNEYPEFVKFFQSLFITTEKLPFLESIMDMAKKRRRILASLIQEGINHGEFGASADPKLACEVFVGTVSHFVWKQLCGEEKILSEQLAEQIVELLFKGLNE
jgi:AcrR family transcriptional regulator